MSAKQETSKKTASSSAAATGAKAAAAKPKGVPSKQPRGMPKKGKDSGKKHVKFVIDCSSPVNDGIMDASGFEKFLHDRIKVDGKAGKLGDKVVISRDKAKIVVTAEAPFSKRSLKYYTKKYLKKTETRDYLRAVSTGKNEYTLRYYSVDSGNADE